MIEALLKEILGALPKRSRDVIVRRFGLKNDGPETLEAIGGSYGITRERVRQVEAAAVRLIRSGHEGSANRRTYGAGRIPEAFGDFEEAAVGYLDRVGGAREERRFLEELKFLTHDKHPASYSRARFLLSLSPKLHRYDESEHRFAFWVIDSEFANRTVKFLDLIVEELKKRGTPMLLADIEPFLTKTAEKAALHSLSPGALVGFAGISKEILMNPYGEWGLFEWNAIVPRGVRDRAYYLVRQRRAPLHFREIAGFLNEHARVAFDFHPAWQKEVEVQTVHNELIKDERFVLVGRGTYALKEWGYEPGTVKDVIKEVLAKSKKPLSKDDIMRQVKEKRLVRENTILINLQNKRLFRRLDDGRYQFRGNVREA